MASAPRLHVAHFSHVPLSVVEALSVACLSRAFVRGVCFVVVCCLLIVALRPRAQGMKAQLIVVRVCLVVFGVCVVIASAHCVRDHCVYGFEYADPPFTQIKTHDDIPLRLSILPRPGIEPGTLRSSV